MTRPAPARGPVVSHDGDVVVLYAGIPGPIVAEAVRDMRGVTDLTASRGRMRFRRLKRGEPPIGLGLVNRFRLVLQSGRV